MRVLIVTPYYPPEIGAASVRISDFAGRWSQAGVEITVLTGFPSYPQGKLYSGYSLRWNHRDQQDKVTIERCLTWPTSSEKFFRRGFGYLLFLFSSFLRGFALPRPDVVVATTPHLFSGLVGFLLAKRWHCAFVLDVRDLWPEAIMEAKPGFSKPFYWLLGKMADGLYRSASLVATTSETQKQHVITRGAQAHNVELIPNGVDLNHFYPRNPDEKEIVQWKEKLDLQCKFVAGFVGNLAFFYDFDFLLRLAKSYERQKNVAWVIVGSGSQEKKLRQEIERMEISNIHLLGAVPFSEVPLIVNALDLVFIPHRDLKLTRGMRPVRLYEALACQRPLLYSGIGEPANLVLESQGGVVIHPGDIEGASREIEAIRLSPERSQQLGKNGERWVKENFDRGKWADRYLSLLNALP